MLPSRVARFHRPPTHPGELIRDLLEDLGWALPRVARRLKMTPGELNAVLNAETAMTNKTARAFAQLLGGGHQLFLRMQEARDLWHAQYPRRASKAAR